MVGNLTFSANQVLMEVPLGVGTKAKLFVGPVIERMTGGTKNLDLPSNRKGYPETCFAKCCNLLVRSWLLISEVVRRSRNYR